jgi:hypothetical protein
MGLGLVPAVTKDDDFEQGFPSRSGHRGDESDSDGMWGLVWLVADDSKAIIG